MADQSKVYVGIYGGAARFWRPAKSSRLAVYYSLSLKNLLAAKELLAADQHRYARIEQEEFKFFLFAGIRVNLRPKFLRDLDEVVGFGD